MKYALFACATVLLCACGSDSGPDSDDTNLPPLTAANHPELPGHHDYPKDVLAQEVTVLQETLEELYPGLYDVRSKARMQQRFDHMRSVASGEGNLSYSQWLSQIVQLIVDLGDQAFLWGHSPNYRQWRDNEVNLPPFNLRQENGKWVIHQVHDDDSGLVPGTEITAIQGKTLDQYLALNSGLLPVQGTSASTQAEWLEDAFAMHHTNFWERPDTYTLTLGDGTQKVVDGITGAEYNVASDFMRTQPRIGFESQEQVAIMTLPTLNYRDLENAGTPYEQAIGAVFSTVKNRGCTSLVIDLRGTAEGHIKVGRELLSYLTDQPLLDSIYKSPTINITHRVYAQSTKMLEPTYLVSMMRGPEQPDLAFDGKVVVLTNGDNRGATGLLVAALRKRPNTMIVGEQPPVFAWGIHHGTYYLEMPYSKVMVGIPSTRLIVDKSKASTAALVALDRAIADGRNALATAIALAAKP